MKLSTAKGQRGAPTLEEVAARAGVSRATASRVLRGASNVSDRARTAVEIAAREIAYTPNRAARSLVTGRSDSVAFLVDETEERMFSDPFFLDMLRGAAGSVAAAGMQLVFTVSTGAQDHNRFISYAAAGHVDGVLLLSLHGREELPQKLESLGVATVLSGRPLEGSRNLYYVDADNLEGGRLATAHLLAAGRKAVATVTGPQDMCAGLDRLSGYRQAFEQLDRPVDESLIVEGEFTSHSGFLSTVELLRERPDVDAIFANSDMAAIGAIRAIEASGRRVYDDVAVVGFDDIPEARDHRPALTTVRQPIRDLGTAMSTRLLQRLAGRRPPRRTVLPVELVVRDTA